MLKFLAFLYTLYNHVDQRPIASVRTDCSSQNLPLEYSTIQSLLTFSGKRKEWNHVKGWEKGRSVVVSGWPVGDRVKGMREIGSWVVDRGKRWKEGFSWLTEVEVPRSLWTCSIEKLTAVYYHYGYSILQRPLGINITSRIVTWIFYIHFFKYESVSMKILSFWWIYSRHSKYSGRKMKGGLICVDFFFFSNLFSLIYRKFIYIYME